MKNLALVLPTGCDDDNASKFQRKTKLSAVNGRRDCFQPIHFIGMTASRFPWIGRRGSSPEEMFGVSVDNIILGVIVIAAVLLIGWIKRQ
jgi:hypothetical protein